MKILITDANRTDSSSDDVVFGEERLSQDVTDQSSQPTVLSAIRSMGAGTSPNPSNSDATATKKTSLSCSPEVNSAKRFLYIAMEYVEGMTLRSAIAAGRLMNDSDEVWAIFHQVK